MGWLRQISLNLYAAGSLYKTYFSDGTRKTLDIKFDIHKTSVGAANESTVTLTNTSPDTKQYLMSLINQGEISVELFAGYENEGMTLLASGNLIRLFPERQGTSDIFTLTFFDGFTAINQSHLEAQFNGGTSLTDIVLALAKSFEKNGVKVDATKINLTGTVGRRGYTAYGRTATALDKLAASYNFTWSIQDGVFQAYMDQKKKRASQAVYKVSVKEKNLLKATPEIGEKGMQLIGMKIEAILNPKCKCMDIIELESIVYPKYNGKYEIHNLTMTGGTKDVDWKMEIDSKTINDGLAPKSKSFIVG